MSESTRKVNTRERDEKLRRARANIARLNRRRRVKTHRVVINDTTYAMSDIEESADN